MTLIQSVHIFPWGYTCGHDRVSTKHLTEECKILLLYQLWCTPTRLVHYWCMFGVHQTCIKCTPQSLKKKYIYTKTTLLNLCSEYYTKYIPQAYTFLSYTFIQKNVLCSPV